MPKKMLLVFAHPDDESFAMGGTIARYSGEGVNITLACLTRGEEGKWGEVTPEPGQELGALRAKELLAAAEVLGIDEVRFLGYRDKTLSEIPYAGPVGKILDLLKQIRPDVVITFGPDGVSGHPDHKAVSRMATEAFNVYVPNIIPHGQNVSASPRLYYVASHPMLRSCVGFLPAPQQ